MLLAVTFCMAVAAVCFAAADPVVGTWKLNEAKSKIPAGAPKNSTVVYSAEGDQYKCVIDGVDGSGNPLHTEWTGAFDGKDYPLTGDPTADMRAIKKVDARHYNVTEKKDGKTTVTGTLVYAADGKSRTVTTHAKDAQGKPVTSTAVYDKQ